MEKDSAMPEYPHPFVHELRLTRAQRIRVMVLEPQLFCPGEGSWTQTLRKSLTRDTFRRMTLKKFNTAAMAMSVAAFGGCRNFGVASEGARSFCRSIYARVL